MSYQQESCEARFNTNENGTVIKASCGDCVLGKIVEAVDPMHRRVRPYGEILTEARTFMRMHCSVLSPETKEERIEKARQELNIGEVTRAARNGRSLAPLPLRRR